MQRYDNVVVVVVAAVGGGILNRNYTFPYLLLPIRN